MSDERDGAGSAGTGTDTTDEPSAVVTRPTRPSGKRARRGAVGEDVGDAVDLATGTKASPTKNGSAKKTAKKAADAQERAGAIRSPTSGTT